MIISIIVAISQNGVIGKQNQLPWHLPGDLKYFKSLTTGHSIIMGRKTFESIGKALPNRTNYVISTQQNFQAAGCITMHSVQEAIEHASACHETEVFIIGGAGIFEVSAHLANRFYLTKVEAVVDGDVHFPYPDTNKWTLLSEESNVADSKNEYPYTFCVYERKS